MNRNSVLFLIFAIVSAIFIIRNHEPNYTDAFYYHNVAQRLVDGQGFTDAYVWTYIGLPDDINDISAIPAHVYWMPSTSVIAALGIKVFNSAKIPFIVLYVTTAYITFWLAGMISQSKRHMWVAGFVAVFSGFYSRFWGMTDNFAPYAVFGALSLIFMGKMLQTKQLKWAVLTGIFAGLGHLTRADGMLLIIVAWLLVLPEKNRWKLLLVITLSYVVVMLPWFLHNINELGTLLPVGGAQGMWYTSYDDLFSYPPGPTIEEFFANGLSDLISSRKTALINNLKTFVAVEGLVVLTPLMLIGLWKQRKNNFFYGFMLYALGLHMAMTFAFPFAGFRGGLFHSSTALLPFWAALSMIGLDISVDWIAKRRRHWQPFTAKMVFSLGIVVLAFVLTWSFAFMSKPTNDVPARYVALQEELPEDARVMVVDPAELYYYTGLGGAVIPNESIDMLPQIAAQYEISHLLVEQDEDFIALPRDFDLDEDDLPDFLTLFMELPNARVYEIHP